MLLKYDKFSNLEQYDGAAQKVSYAYDDLGRVTTRAAECGPDASKLTSAYEYVDGGYGTNSTTPLVKKITQNGISFEYEYDSRGNIVSEKRGNLTTTYAYDALGQLIRVNDPHENATWVYNYDRGGNILSKAKYAYTTGTLGTAVETIPYTYGDSNWKDKLTAYNGTAITYDAIGNPLNGGNWTYEWAVGRQLKKMSREGQSLTFKYDHNGMRIRKVLEHSLYPETTNYTYHGKLLTHMEVNYTDFDEVSHVDKLHFFYDVQSRSAKVRFNGTIYTYVHNLQGDIVGILDSTGNLVVEYRYDAWGKPLSTTGSLADTLGKRNPFRYRGYNYDEESGLYYLRSRYFNPLVGRFVNADCLVSPVLLKGNVFAYCVNEPVSKCDESGQDSRNALLDLVVAIVDVIYQVAKAVVPEKITSEKAQKHLNSLMGEGYSSGMAGRFYGSSGAAKITIAEMSIRSGVVAAIDGIAAAYVTKNIFDPVKVVSKLHPKLEHVAAGTAAVIDSPLKMMFNVRDGYYTYYSYTWYNSISIFGYNIDIGDITYEIRDYGDGFTEVWMSTSDYIFPQNSTWPVKIKSREYK